jgi:hypothetical protein
MVGLDHASQYRWRKADLAVAPAVLPVIAGYRPVAARPEPGTLQIDLAGPTRLVARMSLCGTSCDAAALSASGTVTVVADGYEVRLFQQDGGVDTVRTLTGVGVRPASRCELARLPLGPDYLYHSDCSRSRGRLQPERRRPARWRLGRRVRGEHGVPVVDRLRRLLRGSPPRHAAVIHCGPS